MKAPLKPKQKLGKYTIEKTLARGGFARVYQARDSIEGIKVALKIPLPNLMGKENLELFRKEVRLTAQLDHPNVLPIKYADIIDGQFVIVSPLAEQTLADRLMTRLSSKTALDYAEQMLSGLAEAHRKRIVHCDIKPENMLIFPGNRIRITDFGIARVARHTMPVSGSGTVGYIAPEQAMGKISFASDVFSLGLVLWKMFSGALPEWPYRPPLPGQEKLRSRVHPDMIDFLLRAIEVDPAHRFDSAESMLKAFLRLKRRALRTTSRRRRREPLDRGKDWQELRMRQYHREHGRAFGTTTECRRCKGPIAEVMKACPWCGDQPARFRGETGYPCQCPRCHRGMKMDWRFCPWCYGAAVGPLSDREYSDRRYSARCSNARCTRKQLIPFMQYCPWCNRKVKQKWKIDESKDRCQSCGWGILRNYWNHCPWCRASLQRNGTTRGRA
ncbi:MAG: protein kinase [Spirochaetales bacterium]|nr:protein kinase [Leptospiraceae bacterium]MCP5482341.1 protein kinase [Spirochaetales bacterium]MCP5484220.1 protein kinase [Spirochaetales bacterium]